MVRFVIYRGSVPAGNYPNVKGASIQKPKPTVDTSERSRDRFVLRNAWNTSVLNRSGSVTIDNITSFPLTEISQSAETSSCAFILI